MTHPVIRRRIAERDEMIATAGRYVDDLRKRLQVERAWVAGSVARGDFNVWSDIDVVVVAPDLPSPVLDRMNEFLDAPPRVQVAAFTPEEFDVAVGRRNPLVIEALELGVDLLEPPEKGRSRA